VRPYVDTVLGDTDLSELAKGSSIALVFKVLSLPLGLATSLIISRRYGAEAMGIYGLMTTIMGIVVTVGMLGLGAAMPRFLGEARAKQTGDEQSIYRTSMWTVIVSGVALSV
jgi:O-antigen/teichoic acid export membrane protein